MFKEFVPHQPSLDMKELGFDEPCFGYFDNTQVKGWLFDTDLKPETLLFAPTYSQAFRFFREKYQMMFCYEPCLKKDLTYIFFIYIEATGEKIFVVESKYDEEVELACLKKLIEIVKGDTIYKDGLSIVNKNIVNINFK